MPSRLLFAASLLLLTFVASCSDGAPSAPTVPTPVPTFSLPSAVTPVRPTPAPASRVPPTPAPVFGTATPVRGPLSFNFGAGVDSGDRAIIIRSVEAARDLLQSKGGGSPPCVILAYNSIAELTAAYARLGATQRVRAIEVGRRLAGGVAEAGFRVIAIYTGGDYWRHADAVERSRVIAHEYVHVVQLELEGENRANQLFGTRADAVSPAGPFWLLEGSAEYLSWQVMESLRLGNLDTAMDAYVREAGNNGPPIASLESYAGYAAGGEKGVAKSALAVEFLLRGSSPLALFNFWLETRVGRDWQDTFRIVFLTPVADFYRAFEASVR